MNCVTGRTNEKGGSVENDMAIAMMARPEVNDASQTKTEDVKKSIEIKNLNFYYGDFQGLKNVDLTIHEKKVTAFIGPSGCGKSTLLRTMNRMYDLYPKQRAEGEILFKGKFILDSDVDVNMLRARVGMVFPEADAVSDDDL